MKKGIISFEATILLLAYFLFIGIIVGSLSEANNTAEEKTSLVAAKTDVFKCAVIADSIYSNSGGSIGIKENCFFSERKMKSTINGQSAEEKTMTEKITNSEKGIEIGVEDHYRQGNN